MPHKGLPDLLLYPRSLPADMQEPAVTDCSEGNGPGVAPAAPSKATQRATGVQGYAQVPLAVLSFAGFAPSSGTWDLGSLAICTERTWKLD